MKAIDYLNSLMAGQEMGSSIPIQLTELKALKSFLEADQQCAAHAREVALEEAKQVMEKQHTWITNVAAAQLIEALKAR